MANHSIMGKQIGQQRIPNQFHFVFGLKRQEAPFHLVHYLCLESCRVVNRPEKIFFYYHYEPHGRYWDLIRDKLVLVAVDLPVFPLQYEYPDKIMDQYRYAHLSDFLRLEMLLAEGGIYADIDTIFVNKIPEKLFSKAFVLGKESDIECAAPPHKRPSLCNALIMAEPNATFGKKWLSEMENAFDGTWSNHSTLLPQRLSELYPEHIHVEPQYTFYKHMWTQEGIRTLLEGCDADFTDVASMHLWSHLWWSKHRRDFSDFHGGKITEHHIRRVDTTYNLVARKFLPAARPRWPARLRQMWKSVAKHNRPQADGYK